MKTGNKTSARRRRRSSVFARWLAIRSRGPVCQRLRSFANFYFDVGKVVAALAPPRRSGPPVPDGGLQRGIDGPDRRPGPDAERHDPDQCRRSTATQGIRAVSCSTRFLGWTLCGWVAALMCAVGHRDPTPPPRTVR